ncbi:MAG: hypothetical protein IJY08_06550 [Clostridia bacterium]|nr:hypothetical protein [Clostridia bacterium]
MKHEEKQYSDRDRRKAVSFGRAFGIIIPLCLLGALLAGLVVSVANDMYAFVKPDRDVTVTVDAPLSDKELALLLQKSGVINNAFVFQIYLRSKGKSEELASLTGELLLNSGMSYREILLEIF